MRSRISRWLALALLAVICAGPAVAQQESQQPPPPQDNSLGEAARKAKAEKAKSKPKKVYTEDDLPGLKQSTVSVVGEEPAPAPSPAEETTTLPPLSLDASPLAASGERDETYWRERSGKLRSEMADLDQQIATLKEEIEQGGGAGFDAQTGLNYNVMYFTDRNARLKRLEERKAALQKQIDALRDEARKAGVPPGWLR